MRPFLRITGMALFLSVLCPFRAQALVINNKSDHPMGVIVLQVLDGRNAPVYFKNLLPRNKFSFDPDTAGPFIVSIADIQTKETMRKENIHSDDVLVYNGKDLILTS